MSAPTESPPAVPLQLNVDALTNLAMASARSTADVVGLALRLVEEAGPDATGEVKGGFVGYELGPPPGTPEERFSARRRWLLIKGFQDLTLATRRACEEADVMLAIAAEPVRKTTVAGLETLLAQLRRAANKANLPDLVTRLEGRLGASLDWAAEIRSLNAARNCLEHRRGVVAQADCDPGTAALTVTFPRVRIFYMHKGQEVDLVAEHQMPDDPEEGDEFPVFMQKTRRTLTFPLGSSVEIDAATFAELTFAVWFFANDLRNKVKACALVTTLPRTVS